MRQRYRLSAKLGVKFATFVDTAEHPQPDSEAYLQPFLADSKTGVSMDGRNSPKVTDCCLTAAALLNSADSGCHLPKFDEN